MRNREQRTHDATGSGRPCGRPCGRRCAAARREVRATRGMRGMRMTRGFTLVEILIVVVILGILATIVIPQFSNASLQARENSLKDDLRYLRVQIQVYKAQHRDVSPGYPGGDTSATPTEADFVDQMTKHTSEQGVVSTTASNVYKYGPYLSTMPTNPMTGKSTVTIVTGFAAMPAPTTNDGWLYQPDTQKVMANMTGTDSTGIKYADY